MTRVTLSLVSHTNVGKTTLARTLLRRDVGEVIDQPHVTEVSEAHTLIEAGGDELLLWDTPGFGDTARLLKRLRREDTPIGWLLHQVWDRTRDRPLWCSQEAVRNVRDDADVVLYLVNASERPDEAGYVGLELEVLAWLGRPVLLLLNQTGAGGDHERALEGEWREAVADRDVVRDVLPLDAFTRCWVQEDLLLERVVALLEGERRAVMERLAAAWRERNRETFAESCARMAEHLARTATNRETIARLARRPEKKRAMEALARRLEESERAAWDAVIAAHGLEGEAAVEARRGVESFVVSGEELLDPRKGAVVGGALTGAAGGLAADFLAGGLTFFGGLLSGAVLGALGGAGLTHAVRLVRSPGEPAVGWSPEFLDLLLRQTCLRYLAVAHFGRGRGRYSGGEEDAWHPAVDRAVDARADELRRRWSRAAEGPRVRDALARDLERDLREVLTRVLVEAYPEAASDLGSQ